MASNALKQARLERTIQLKIGELEGGWRHWDACRLHGTCTPQPRALTCRLCGRVRSVRSASGQWLQCARDLAIICSVIACSVA